MFLRHLTAWAVSGCLAALLYVAYVGGGWFAAPQTSGTLLVSGVRAPVRIVRDARGVPHIRAGSAHDAFFAQGFAEGSDRLFQLDMMRRFTYGTLSEVLGSRTLASDETMRAYDAVHVVQREWRNARAPERAALQAFSDGVNAAMRTQPLPIGFRALLYHPHPWTPRDSLAVGIALAAQLSDGWQNVIARDAVWRSIGAHDYAAFLPLSDPRYDEPIVGRVRDTTLAAVHHPAPTALAARIRSAPLGSNAWAVGGARTQTKRALLANDPHLALTIPGPWYLIDIAFPGMHAAGASIPGIPGVMLGHNQNVAWGSTNATVADTLVFDVPHPPASERVCERFHVRLARDAVQCYYRTPHAFSIPSAQGSDVLFVRWRPYEGRDEPIAVVLALDRARSLSAALRALRSYADPAQNFVLADRSGRVAYQLAGKIPDDPAWGRYVHDARALHAAYPPVPFTRLPSLQPARNAVVVSANNRMYGDAYPYRLSAAFAPPYRAYRITHMLESEPLTAASFERMQMDTESPADLAFAQRIVHYARANPGILPPSLERTLAAWNGHYAPSSDAATLEHAMRTIAEGDDALFPGFLQRLRSGTTAQYEWEPMQIIWDALENPHPLTPWRRAGAVRIENPIDLWFLNGGTLPGDGDEFTVHVQEAGFAQSFRAVWNVGNWDAGGIILPSGESGEPGSGHYTDELSAWKAGNMIALPFSTAAVARAARSTLTLKPP